MLGCAESPRPRDEREVVGEVVAVVVRAELTAAESTDGVAGAGADVVVAVVAMVGERRAEAWR